MTTGLRDINATRPQFLASFFVNVQRFNVLYFAGSTMVFDEPSGADCIPGGV